MECSALPVRGKARANLDQALDFFVQAHDCRLGGGGHDARLIRPTQLACLDRSSGQVRRPRRVVSQKLPLGLESDHFTFQKHRTMRINNGRTSISLSYTVASVPCTYHVHTSSYVPGYDVRRYTGGKQVGGIYMYIALLIRPGALLQQYESPAEGNDPTGGYNFVPISESLAAATFVFRFLLRCKRPCSFVRGSLFRIVISQCTRMTYLGSLYMTPPYCFGICTDNVTAPFATG